MNRIFIFLLFLSHGVAVTAQRDIQKIRAPDAELLILKQKHQRALDRDDRRAAGLCLQQMGKLCFNQGHYSMGLDFYQKADRMFVAIGDKELIGNNLTELGTLFYYNRQEAQAFDIYKRALALYRASFNKKGIADVFGKIGHLYEKKQHYDSAFFYQRRALSLYEQASYPDGAASIFENLGSIHEDLANYDSAAFYFNKSLAIYRLRRNQNALIEVVNNLGDLKRKTGNFKEAIALSRVAWKGAQQHKNLYQLASCSKDLALAYKLAGDPDSAFHFMELARKCSLELYSTEAIKQTSFLQVLYDIDQKSDEIAKLESTRKINYIIAGASVLVLLLIMILAMVIISRQRLKIKDQNALARQKEAEHELVQLDLKNRSLEEENLKKELHLRTRELSNHTLSQVKSNQLLEELRTSLQAMIKDDKRDQKRQMQQLVSRINESFNNESNWLEFSRIFEQVHQSFFDKLKTASSDLTSADMRLIALMKMNLSSADISTLLGISQDSLRVSRYRLRKKLRMPQGDNLSAFIQSL